MTLLTDTARMMMGDTITRRAAILMASAPDEFIRASDNDGCDRVGRHLLLTDGGKLTVHTFPDEDVASATMRVLMDED